MNGIEGVVSSEVIINANQFGDCVSSIVVGDNAMVPHLILFPIHFIVLSHGHDVIAVSNYQWATRQRQGFDNTIIQHRQPSLLLLLSSSSSSSSSRSIIIISHITHYQPG